MMEFGEIRPVLAALVLPPAGPLLLAVAGLAVAWKYRRFGQALALGGIASLWFLSCHAVAIALSIAMLPPVTPLAPGALKDGPVQAIVILGGGVLPTAPEYGQVQPAGPTASRLRYGLWLAQTSRLPVAFAGGIGWSASATGTATEGEVARRLAQDRYGITLKWVDDQSRDTVENARLLARLMQKDGVRRVALVTDAWHMPRSVRAFERAGFKVLQAPTGFPVPRERRLLEWMPSSHGLGLSRAVLREWLGLWVARLSGS